MDKLPLALAIALLFLGTLPAMAASDAGLYDPAPPAGSAFVRFVSDLDNKGAKPVEINGKNYDYLDYKEVSPYYTLAGGNVVASIGQAKDSFNLEAGKYYTVVLGDHGALRIEEDPKNDNRAKAQIILYNLSGQDDISIKAADGSIEVIPPVAAGAKAQRLINPVRVQLAVYKGDRKIKDLGTPSLERARSYSAFAVSADEVNWVESTTNTSR